MSARPPAPHRAGVVLASLRDEILRGDLPHGAPLREQTIANRFGVSRGTVRGALQMLVRERLATSEPYRGVRVVDLTPAQVVELQQVRCALESEAVRIIAQRHGTGRWPVAVLAPALRHLDHMRRLAASPAPDPTALDVLHSRLHLAVVEACGNRRLLEQYHSLDAELRMMMLRHRTQLPPRHVLAMHREYLAQLPRRGDAAVRDHIVTTLDDRPPAR